MSRKNLFTYVAVHAFVYEWEQTVILINQTIVCIIVLIVVAIKIIINTINVIIVNSVGILIITHRPQYSVICVITIVIVITSIPHSTS